jgi:hypothetical protein
MLPPWRYEQARHDARFHVQVAVRQVQADGRPPGKAAVGAEVVRVFHGGDALRPGDEVTFAVSVLTPDTPRQRVPVGGTRWTDYAALRAAAYPEVVLNGRPPACEVALWQLAIIPAPTDRPMLRGRIPLTLAIRAARGFVARLLGRWFGPG